MRAPAPGRIGWAAIVAALTILSFGAALSNGWVDFDDTAFILRNPRLASLSWQNLAWMFTSFEGGHFHPLTWLSWALNLEAAGTGALSFHLVDLALHASNTVIFFHIARRFLEKSNPAAAAAALFFAIHPLRVESVAWAIERRDVLSGCFYLAAILYHLKALDEPSRPWRAVSCLAYALSLLSKSIGITLPLALVLLDLYPLKRLPLDLRRWAQREFYPVWREKLPYALFALLAAAAAFLAEASNGSTLGLSQNPLGSRIATVAFGLAFYMRKTVLPLNLLPLYELPRHLEPFSAPYLASAALVVAAIAVLFLLRRRCPEALAASSYYFITVFPVLGLVRFGPQLAADRYSYLSCLGWALLFGAAVLAGLRKDRETQKLTALLACSVLATLGLLTWRQTARWRDPVTLWSYALGMRGDSAMGQQHLGYALAERGRFTEALTRYQEATRLNPDYWLAYNNLGNALAALGRLDEACAQYGEAIRLKPDYWEARSNLGLSLARQNKLAQAEAQFKEALSRQPQEPGLHNNLGLVYFTQGRRKLAAEQFHRALELNPRQPQARMMIERLARKP